MNWINRFETLETRLDELEEKLFPPDIQEGRARWRQFLTAPKPDPLDWRARPRQTKQVTPWDHGD